MLGHRSRRALAMIAASLFVVSGLVTWPAPRPASAGATPSAQGASGALPPEPDDDPFYQPPAGFESTAPGTVLRSRPVTVTGFGIPIPVRSTQILARSSDAHGQPVAVATTLMIPATPWLIGQRPLLSYQAAIDSLGDQCNPSYTLRIGTEKELPLMASALLNGWAVVVTDYQGPRDAYGAGPMEGHGVLDGIRAAERLPGTGLAGSSTPVGMWGYSGGALATSWAAELQPTYAPELNVRGIASGGTPPDLEAAARTIDGGPFSGLGLAAVVGITREYPELLTLINDRGQQLIQQIGDMCYNEESASFPFRRLNEFTHSRDPLSEPVAQEVLGTLRLGQQAPTAPVYLYHSIFDELIPFHTAQALRVEWCRQGVAVQFYADPVSEHVILAVTGAPAALSYLSSRFAGIPAPDNCP